MFGDSVKIVEGDSTVRADLERALPGCDAVHVSLPTESELDAVRHLVDLAAEADIERISYVSGTSVREKNRWFDVIDVKLQAESLLHSSGLPHTVFCPTWVMEVLPNFIKKDRAVAIVGKNPPPLHFFAADDFGRMVADSFDDDRVLSRRLFVHGPEAFTLPQAIERYHQELCPELKLLRLKLWQARVMAKLTRNKRMAAAIRLIGYFDRSKEGGDPSEANSILGAPTTTLAEWIEIQKEKS
jgi:uncharacterized protein YbjT (DUF2867 family)